MMNGLSLMPLIWKTKSPPGRLGGLVVAAEQKEPPPITSEAAIGWWWIRGPHIAQCRTF